MKLIATYSGGKGGTGKTTILSYLSMLVSTIRQTLIIDCSSEGGISNLMLGNPSPPYLRDFLLNRVSLYEAISSYEVDVSDKIKISFNMIPNLGSIPLDRLNHFTDIIVNDPLLRRGINICFIDIPTFQENKYYINILEKTLVLIVMEPTTQSINAAINNNFKNKIYILNSPHPLPRQIISDAVKTLGKKGIQPIVFPYDPAAAIASKYFPRTLAHLSKDFTNSLRNLALKILNGV